MKTKLSVSALVVFIAFVAFLGCDKLNFLNPKNIEPKKIAPSRIIKGTVVAKVNNIPITLDELNKDIDSYNNMVGDKPEAKITTRDQKINYLKSELVSRTLLYQDALDRGLDRKEEIINALEKKKQELVVTELLNEESEKIEVSSKEVEDYYNNYKEQLKEPEERQIREIMVPTEQEAKDMLIQFLQGNDFATLAKERSKSSSAKDGGDLGFIQKGKKFAQFDAVAFSDTLEVGKTSNIFKGPEGYYILKLEAKRGGKQKSLSEMWDDIKRVLTFIKQQQKIEDIIAKLSREVKIEIYEGEIK